MTKPHYTGRRVAGKPRLLYVNAEEERDITPLLEEANITFISDIDWKGCGRQLVELAKTIIWHATRSHEMVHMWGPSFSWELLAFLEDGWTISADAVNRWIARRELDAREPRREHSGWDG